MTRRKRNKAGRQGWSNGLLAFLIVVNLVTVIWASGLVLSSVAAVKAQGDRPRVMACRPDDRAGAVICVELDEGAQARLGGGR